MEIKIVAPKATERQKNQLEKWIWEEMAWKINACILELEEIQQIPVIMRRVAAKHIRERKK